MCRCKFGIRTVMDASLLQDNLFVKTREEACKYDYSLNTAELAKNFDIIYFSARKLGFARGSGICIRKRRMLRIKVVPLFEGF